MLCIQARAIPAGADRYLGISEVILAGRLRQSSVATALLVAYRDQTINYMVEGFVKGNQPLRTKELRSPPKTREWLDALEAGATDYCSVPIETRQLHWLMESTLPRPPTTSNCKDIFIFDRTGVDAQGRVQGRFRGTGVKPRIMERFRVSGIELPESVFSESLAVNL
jgi:hypothetical protein